MKKAIAVLLTILIASVLLASCGGSTSDSISSSPGSGKLYSAQNRVDAGGGGGYSSPEASTAPYAAPMLDDSYELNKSMDISGETGAVAIAESYGNDNMAEKVIYTAHADIETTDFDASIDEVDNLLSSFGAFIESSYVGGKNYTQSYYGMQTFRTANYTLRVPVDRLKVMIENLGNLGNVIMTQNDSQNITMQFYDTQSRLNSLKIQEERLLDMLMRADTVTDMITIEERLGDVRYSIETLTSTLMNWQNQVDYSTLTLNIREVQDYTELVPIKQTYWEQIGAGISSTTKNVGGFFMDLFKWIVVNSPILVILAVIAVVIIILARRGIKRRKAEHERPVNAGYVNVNIPNNYPVNNYPINSVPVNNNPANNNPVGVNPANNNPANNNFANNNPANNNPVNNNPANNNPANNNNPE